MLPSTATCAVRLQAPPRGFPLAFTATLLATACLGAFPFRYIRTPGFTLSTRFAKLKDIRLTTNRLWNL